MSSCSIHHEELENQCLPLWKLRGWQGEKKIEDFLLIDLFGLFEIQQKEKHFVRTQWKLIITREQTS